MDYRTPYGLPVRHSAENGIHIENEFLFGLYEKLFTGNEPKKLKNFYFKVSTLGYPNHINDSVPEKEISHDQLTAYSCFSFQEGFTGHKDIYNKISGIKVDGRSLHPRDYIYYLLLNKNLLGIILVPFLYLFCAASSLIGFRIVKQTTFNEVFSAFGYTLQKKLSGELLWILRYESVKNDSLLKILMYPCKLLLKIGAKIRFGGIQNMITEYFFNQEDHPIVSEYNYDA